MVWKALADPTRRTILTLLQESPLTTGEISERIDDLSRYAVMKHLGILESARLIRTRREGKFRWNYLNATPLQHSYEHWLRQLVQIARQTTPKMGAAKKTIMTATFSLEHTLPAAISQSWDALINKATSWWPRNLLYYNASSELILENEIGGKLFEKSGPEDGFLWAHVIGLEKEKSLMLKGQLIPKLGGPAISFIQFDFEKKAKRQTQLNFSCTLFGEFRPKAVQEQQDNWELIIKKGLVDFLKEG